MWFLWILRFFFSRSINCRNNDAMDVNGTTWQQKEKIERAVVLEFPLFPRLPFALSRSIKISALISSTLDSQLSAAPEKKRSGRGKTFLHVLFLGGLRFWGISFAPSNALSCRQLCPPKNFHVQC